LLPHGRAGLRYGDVDPKLGHRLDEYAHRGERSEINGGARPVKDRSFEFCHVVPI